MLTFLITFTLMLLLGSIFILGFFTITRGKEVVLPNGNKEIEKEIFGDWQLFWEQVVKYKRVYYYDKQLEYKLKILEQLKPAYMEEIKLDNSKKSLIPKEVPTPAQLRDIEWSLNTNVLWNEVAIFLYDEFPEYRFPEWVRKITNCYVCLTGWMGTLCYWTLNYFNPHLFDWSSNPLLCKIAFWVVYCISLAFINKVVKENLDSDKK